MCRDLCLALFYLFFVSFLGYKTRERIASIPLCLALLCFCLCVCVSSSRKEKTPFLVYSWFVVLTI